MKFLLLTLLFISSLFAQESDERDALVGALFEARDVPSFQKAFAAATAAKISNQILVEARFLHLVDNANRATIAAFAPVLKAQLEKDEMKESAIFAVKEDFMAVYEYTLALGALEKKDDAAFKKHITEAYWLSPSQAGVFGPHINEHRLAKKMAEVTLDLDRELEVHAKESSKTSLKTILGDSPAIALHFWTPWAQESANSFPDFLATAEVLHKNKIPVASVLITGNAQSRTDADSFLSELKSPLPGSWLIDEKTDALTSTLRIATFPTIVLISKEGSVLFHGDPGANEFWNKLKKLSPKITRPLSPVTNPPLDNESESNNDKGDE
ncbi:hypothetical protein N9A86_02800 [Akkermansiaceae bacterium]|nr:hypothetical protein [Akkermansiaceae bacterium]